jgi:hypothetical protein
MPITANKLALYPGGSIRSPEWLAIRARILLRAGNRCEGTPMRPTCRAENGQPHPETGSKVVLTIAHMDRQLVDHTDANLRALCQRCHLGWDAVAHRAAAAKTRRAKSSQMDMLDASGL